MECLFKNKHSASNKKNCRKKLLIIIMDGEIMIKKIINYSLLMFCMGIGANEKPNSLPLPHGQSSTEISKSIASATSLTIKHPTFNSWKNSCQLLSPVATACCTSHLLTNELMIGTLNQFLETNKNELLKMAWLNDKQLPEDFFEYEKTSYLPHVQKLVLHTHAKVAIHGDIHGDIHSVLGFMAHLQTKGYLDKLDGFKIIDPNFYMLFLGDYTDRGRFGTEVIYTLLRLKLTNPDKVILVRGNHEDIDQNEGDFSKEIFEKFPKQFSTIKLLLHNMYQRLPVALYLGSGAKPEFALCCHGGIEWGYNPANLLATENNHIAERIMALNRIKNIAHLSTVKKAIEEVIAHKPAHAGEYQDGLCAPSPQAPITNGFMWFDFFVKNNVQTPLIDYIAYRGWKLGKIVTQALMKDTHIKTLFRAHQHGDKEMMNLILNWFGQLPEEDTGVAKLWDIDGIKPGELKDGMVVTFCVSPHTNGFGKANSYTFDAYGLLHFGESFNDWRLNVYRVDSNGKEIN